MQPCESSLNFLRFLKVFLDLPPPLSLESVFFVAKASSVLFIIYQVLHSCVHLNPLVSSVELEASPFVAGLVIPDPMLL